MTVALESIYVIWDVNLQFFSWEKVVVEHYFLIFAVVLVFSSCNG